MLRVLHAGCGAEPLPAWIGECDEVRLDIDHRCEPHVVAPITALGDIGEFDVVYTSHCLEHLFPHQVAVALGEFKRVLKAGGKAIIIVPDLEDVRPTEEALYLSPAGPICGLDMIYGKASMIAENPFMAHKCGFTRETLAGAIAVVEFGEVKVERIAGYSLLAVAVKGE
jgi:SAM-dependent methyltransferase